MLVFLAAMSLPAFDKLDLTSMSRPKPVVKPEPKYSEEAREARVEGSVPARVFIDTDGLISQVEILQPLGFGLDLAALEALAQWRHSEPRASARRCSCQATGAWSGLCLGIGR